MFEGDQANIGCDALLRAIRCSDPIVDRIARIETAVFDPRIDAQVVLVRGRRHAHRLLRDRARVLLDVIDDENDDPGGEAGADDEQDSVASRLHCGSTLLHPYFFFTLPFRRPIPGRAPCTDRSFSSSWLFA